MSQSRVIAITGGIGVGKSTVCNLLQEWGYPVIDCDKLAEETSNSPEMLAKIQSTFGGFVVDGKLQRKELGKYVFADKDRTKQLDELFHEQIIQTLAKRLSNIVGLTFVEVSVAKALPYELVDEVWEIVASDELRKKRVMFRDDKREEEINDIMARQTKPTKVDVIIENNGYIDELKQKLIVLVDKRK